MLPTIVQVLVPPRKQLGTSDMLETCKRIDEKRKKRKRECVGLVQLAGGRLLWSNKAKGTS